jgi:hypothetical protein
MKNLAHKNLTKSLKQQKQAIVDKRKEENRHQTDKEAARLVQTPDFLATQAEEDLTHDSTLCSLSFEEPFHLFSILMKSIQNGFCDAALPRSEVGGVDTEPLARQRTGTPIMIM